MNETVAKFGKIEVLLNNAVGPPALIEFKEFPEISDEELRSAMDRKFLPYASCARAAVPYMIRQGGSKINNTAEN